MVSTTPLLDNLYEKEKELICQLNAVRETIKAFGGDVSIEKTKTVSIKTSELPSKGTPYPEIKEIKIQSIPIPELSKVEESKEKVFRNNKEDVKLFIVEIMKEVNAPCRAKVVVNKLSGMGMEYGELTVEQYMRELEKEGHIVKSGPRVFCHINYVEPVMLQKKVKTIHDILDYFKLRKESTRQDLINFFVKGGRMNEGRLDLRLAKLIESKQITRLEVGVYKYIGK